MLGRGLPSLGAGSLDLNPRNRLASKEIHQYNYCRDQSRLVRVEAMFIVFFFVFIQTLAMKICTSRYFQGWEPANFLAAPAPDFFPKRLRLRLLVFFRAAPAPAPMGQKTALAPDYWLRLAKYSFSRKLVRGNCKKYITSKITVYLTIKTYYFTLPSLLTNCIRGAVQMYRSRGSMDQGKKIYSLNNFFVRLLASFLFTSLFFKECFEFEPHFIYLTSFHFSEILEELYKRDLESTSAPPSPRPRAPPTSNVPSASRHKNLISKNFVKYF